MDNNLQTMIDQRLKRIVEECLEVSLILCNREMEQFGVSKILDIFVQTISTGFVLNTGYWPFFSSTRGQCLCVCGRFGIFCRHVKGRHHWIDMNQIENGNDAVTFYPKVNGYIYLLDHQISITHVYRGYNFFYISIYMQVQTIKHERSEHERATVNPMQAPRAPNVAVNNQMSGMTVRMRFILLPEFYSSFQNIFLKPNPFFYEQYGTYFRNLSRLRAITYANCQNDYRNFFFIPIDQMANATLILDAVDIPIYKFPAHMVGFYCDSNYFRQNVPKTTRPKSTQTPWTINMVDPEHRNRDYSYDMATVAGIWSYPADLPQTLSQQPEDIAEASSSAATPNDMLNEIIIIEDSPEYDNQDSNVDYDDIITPHSTINQTIKVEMHDHDYDLPTLTDAEMYNYYPTTIQPEIIPDNAITTIQKAKRESSLTKNSSQNIVTPAVVEKFTKLCDDNTAYFENPIPSTSKDFTFAVPAVPKVKHVNPKSKNPNKDAEWKMKQAEIDAEFDLIQSVISEDIIKEGKNNKSTDK